MIDQNVYLVLQSLKRICEAGRVSDGMQPLICPRFLAAAVNLQDDLCNLMCRVMVS